MQNKSSKKVSFRIGKVEKEFTDVVLGASQKLAPIRSYFTKLFVLSGLGLNGLK